MSLTAFQRYRRIAEEHGAKGLDQLETKYETERPEPGSPVNPFTSEIPEQPQPELPDHPDQQPQPGIVPETQPYTLPPDNGAAPPSIQPDFLARSAEQQEAFKAANVRNIAEQEKEASLNQEKMSKEGEAIQQQEAQVANVPEEGTPTEPVGEPAPSQTEKDNETAESLMAEEDDGEEPEQAEGDEPIVRRKRGRPRKTDA